MTPSMLSDYYNYDHDDSETTTPQTPDYQRKKKIALAFFF